MADTLRTRVGRIIAGGAHALLDKIEDAAPEAMLEQALREIQGVTDEVRHELGIVSANKHLAQQQHAKLNQKHSELANQAREALAQTREDLARAAVQHQLDIEAQLPVLENSLADLGKQEIELRGYVDALMAKQRELREAIEAFIASRKSAASATGGGIIAGSAEGKLANALQAFDTVFRRQTGLTPAAHQVSLERGAKLKELEDMVRDKTIEERLAQLKAPSQ